MTSSIAFHAGNAPSLGPLVRSVSAPLIIQALNPPKEPSTRTHALTLAEHNARAARRRVPSSRVSWWSSSRHLPATTNINNAKRAAPVATGLACIAILALDCDSQPKRASSSGGRPLNTQPSHPRQPNAMLLQAFIAKHCAARELALSKKASFLYKTQPGWRMPLASLRATFSLFVNGTSWAFFVSTDTHWSLALNAADPARQATEPRSHTAKRNPVIVAALRA